MPQWRRKKFDFFWGGGGETLDKTWKCPKNRTIFEFLNKK